MPSFSNSDDDYTVTVNYTLVDNPSGNNTTVNFNMTVTANTSWYSNSTQTWGYLYVNGVTIIDNWSDATGAFNRGFTGTKQTITVATGSGTYAHNNDGSRGGIRIQAGWRTGFLSGQDFAIYPGIFIDQTTANFTDYTRLPSTPSVASLSRGSNGTSISLTASNATFYGSGGYYQYIWSYDNANWNGPNAMSGTSGSGSGFSSTNTIFVQVRAVDSEGASGWSSSASIQGVPDAPGAAPTLTRTADGSSITLTSATATRATAYSYRQSTDGVNWGGTVNISSGTAVTITGLIYDQTYFYQTLGRNEIGSGAWSATRSIAGVLPAFTNTNVTSPAVWGQPYSSTTLAANRARSFSIVASPNNLPTGLSLNTSTGAITGAVTATNPFSFTFKIRATNNAGSVDTADRTLNVISPVRVNTVDAGPTGPASFATGAVNVLTVTGPTASFKTGIVRVWNGSTFVPSRLA
jgi:hypothetical protein